MKQAILLAVLFLVLVISGAGCNGVGLNDPTSTTPGETTDDPMYDYGKIEANIAIDKPPQREIEPIPMEDPVWEPVFDCLTDDETCVDEGCMSFEIVSFDEDTRIASFKATFFNPNADDLNGWTIFLFFTDLADGIELINPDGERLLERFGVEEFPYYAFNADTHLDGEETPDSMYCYYQREISFQLEYGSDFYVDYTLIAETDKNTVYSIRDQDETGEDNESPDEGDGRTGGGSSFGNETNPTEKVNADDGSDPNGSSKGSSFEQPDIVQPDE